MILILPGIVSSHIYGKNTQGQIVAVNYREVQFLSQNVEHLHIQTFCRNCPILMVDEPIAAGIRILQHKNQRTAEKVFVLGNEKLVIDPSLF